MATNTKKTNATLKPQKQHASPCPTFQKPHSKHPLDPLTRNHASDTATQEYLPGGATYQRLLQEISSGNPRREPVPQWLDSWQRGYERSTGEKTTTGTQGKEG